MGGGCSAGLGNGLSQWPLRLPPAWAMAAHYRSAGLHNGHYTAHPTSVPEASQSMKGSAR